MTIVERVGQSGQNAGGAMPYPTNDDGSVDIPLPEEVETGPSVPEEVPFYGNLADVLEESRLNEIAYQVYDDYDVDKESRSEWDDMIVKGINLLGLRVDETSDPFEGACNATHPMLMESAVKYEAKVIQELFPPGGPVKCEIIGPKTDPMEQTAQRVQEFMNYQLTEQMGEYYDDMERLLISLPLVGIAIKKTYFDPSLNRPVSEFIPIDTFHVYYYAPDLRRAERYTHEMVMDEVRFSQLKKAGVYRDIDISTSSTPDRTAIQEAIDLAQGFAQPNMSSGEVYTLLEQHRYLSLEEDGDEPLPYVITIDKDTKKVLSIRRNWKENDPLKEKLLWFSTYKFVPGFGFYGLGYIHLLGNLAMTTTSAMRALVDAGQFANLPGGFKAKDLRILNNDPIAPGEFRDIESPGQALKDSIIPLPYKEPSQVLFQMLQWLDVQADQFADNTDAVVSNATNYGPVGTTLALLEASAKFIGSVNKRVHKALRDELKILKYINATYLPKVYPYDVAGGNRLIYAQDFVGSVNIVPVSDPNIPTQAHRLTIAQTVLQTALQTPQYHDMREVLRVFYSTLNNSIDADKILPPPAQAFSGDPVQENMMMMQSKPVQASAYQDHDAHIISHTSFLNDPNYGASDMGRSVAPSLANHIKEHMAQKYKREIELTMGQQLPQQISPQMELPLSHAEAQAGVAILHAAAVMCNMTPDEALVDLKKQELALKAQELQDKHAREVANLAVKHRALDIQQEGLTLKAHEKGVDVAADLGKQQLQSDTKLAVEHIKAASKRKSDV